MKLTLETVESKSVLVSSFNYCLLAIQIAKCTVCASNVFEICVTAIIETWDWQAVTIYVQKVSIWKE